jgi:hypothetical protein
MVFIMERNLLDLTLMVQLLLVNLELDELNLMEIMVLLNLDTGMEKLILMELLRHQENKEC